MTRQKTTDVIVKRSRTKYLVWKTLVIKAIGVVITKNIAGKTKYVIYRKSAHCRLNQVPLS